MKTVSSLCDLDIKYYIDIDPHITHHHELDYEHDMCRCGKIESFEIKSISYEALAKKIASYYGYKTLVDNIERILRNQSTDFESWIHVEIDGGYYGEEIGRCFITDETLQDKINRLKDFDESELIKQCLIEEYGYLLPKLIDATFILETVEIDTIYNPNKNYSRKLDRSKIINIKNNHNFKKLPACIVDRDFSIIDGYHRYAAAKELKLKKIKVFRVV